MAKYKEEEAGLESLKKSQEQFEEKQRRLNLFINQPFKGLDLLFSENINTYEIPQYTIHYNINSHISKNKDEKEAYYKICKKLLEEKAEILEDNHYLGAVSDLCEYNLFWMRDIETWEKKSHNVYKQFISIVNHLLVKKKVPTFMYFVWTDTNKSKELSIQRDWFIKMGEGGSIKGDVHLPKNYTSKMLHHFLNTPDDYSVKEALVWGRVHAFGGDERLVNCINESRLRNLEINEFWDSVIKFFADNPMMDSALISPIIDYIYNQKYHPVIPRDADGRVLGPGRPVQPNMVMKGRNPDTLIRESDHWHFMLALEERRKEQERRLALRAQRVGGRGAAGRNNTVSYSYNENLKWAPYTRILPFEKTEGGKNNRTTYKIVELLNSKDLREEGSAMFHCVGSYSNACHSGRSSIWSLRANQNGVSTRLLTIEISRNDFSVVQMRGKRNAMPSPKEKAIIVEWATKYSLKMSRWI